MTNQDIRNMLADGVTFGDILRAVIEDGREFPDAVYKVCVALGLKRDKIAEMLAQYDDSEA